MPSKFKIGDKVRINPKSKRIPNEFRKTLRMSQIRTIIGIFYDTKTKHNRYYLGDNKRGIIGNYPFRAETLKPYKTHLNRKYNKRDRKYWARISIG